MRMCRSTLSSFELMWSLAHIAHQNCYIGETCCPRYNTLPISYQNLHPTQPIKNSTPATSVIKYNISVTTCNITPPHHRRPSFPLQLHPSWTPNPYISTLTLKLHPTVHTIYTLHTQQLCLLLHPTPRKIGRAYPKGLSFFLLPLL